MMPSISPRLKHVLQALAGAIVVVIVVILYVSRGDDVHKDNGPGKQVSAKVEGPHPKPHFVTRPMPSAPSGVAQIITATPDGSDSLPMTAKMHVLFIPLDTGKYTVFMKDKTVTCQQMECEVSPSPWVSFMSNGEPVRIVYWYKDP